MRIDIGETECKSAQKARYSAERLLERLKEHHDFSVRRPEHIPPRLRHKMQPIVLAAKPALPYDNRPEPHRPLIGAIQRAVAKHYGVTRDEIISQRRPARVVRPRQVAMYLSREMTLHSLPSIGRAFGGRDHTTVLHAIRKMEALVSVDPMIAGVVESVTAELSA